MIGEAIYHILTTDSDVSALIGLDVYPNLVPQSDPKTGEPKTAAWYDTEDVAPLKCSNPNGAFDGIIEVGVISPDFDKLILVMRAVRKALDNYRGLAAGFGLRIYTGTEGQAGFDDQLKLHGKSLRWKILGQIVTP